MFMQKTLGEFIRSCLQYTLNAGIGKESRRKKHKVDMHLSGYGAILEPGGENMQRLFDILYYLMQNEGVTAGKLADRLGVSVRTVYRDIEYLSGAGIPVYADRGRGGGIRLLDGFVLDRSLLSGEEKREILAALQSLQAVRAEDTDGALHKLGALFGQKAGNWVEIDFSNWSPRDRERFYLLKEAVIGQKVIAFDYYGKSGEKTSRSAEPLQLWFKDRAWFLKAFCRTRGALRIFKVSRMKNMAVTKETFRRELPAQAETPEKASFRTVTVSLRLSPEMAYRVYDEFDDAGVTRNADGSFTVRQTYPEDEWVYGYILSFGNGATVDGPAHIREGVRERLYKTLENYK